MTTVDEVWKILSPYGEVFFVRAADTYESRELAEQAEAVPVMWRCFHCNQSFSTKKAAAEHFGKSEHQYPACQIDIAEYREMEARMLRYNEEDTDLHRAMYGMQSEHQVALRRAEEAGYAKALKDTNYAKDAPVVAPQGVVEDSTRLDWLSLHPRGAQFVVDGQAKNCIFWGISSDPENTLREAIDAAIAAQALPTHGGE